MDGRTTGENSTHGCGGTGSLGMRGRYNLTERGPLAASEAESYNIRVFALVGIYSLFYHSLTPHSNLSLLESLHCFPPTHTCIASFHYSGSMLLEHESFLGTGVTTYASVSRCVLHAQMLGPPKHLYTYEAI